MGEAAFCVEARVREALPNGTFVAGRDKKVFAGLRAGDMAKLQLTPYDLSVGRILVETKKF